MKSRMTQQEVADFLGIQRSAVSEIETSARDVSALELRAFSRLYGQDLDALFGAADQQDALRRLLLRASDVTEQGRRSLARFTELCASYRDLEEKLAPPPLNDVRAVDKTLLNVDDAEQLAEQERRRLDLGVTPSRQLLDVLEEGVGVKVLALEMPTELSGASVRDPYFGPAILLNSKQWPARQVFTLAHEYFHLLTHGHVEGELPQDDADAHINFAAPVSEKPRVELLADHFGGAMLMPREHLKLCITRLLRNDSTVNTLDLVGLARYFGVSVQALFRRLAVLGLITREASDAAYSDATLQDEILRVGGVAAPEPARLKRLAVRAYAEGIVTKDRLGELLGVSKFEIDREVRRYGGAGHSLKVETDGRYR